MWTRRWSLLPLGVALLSATSACGSGDLLGPDAQQGVEGVVLIGPQCPVQSTANPCPDLPYQASIYVRSRGGAFVTRVSSGADGTFRVGLRPGLYTLEPESGDPFPVAGPQDVEVVSDEYSQVTISFDTGIR